jgi:hypothetical protein
MTLSPVLSIITRCHPERLGMLVRLADSIRAMPGSNRIQWLQIQDPGGPTGRAGIARMNAALAEVDLSDARGDYVWIIDDDDLLLGSPLVETLASELQVAWYMVRAYLGGPEERHDGVWPRPWGEDWRPVFGKVSMLNLIVRRDVFEEFQSELAVDSGADFRLASAMWEAGLRPRWLDRIVLASRTQRISDGQAEEDPPEVLEVTRAEFSALTQGTTEGEPRTFTREDAERAIAEINDRAGGGE